MLDPRFREHDPGHGCPESPARYDALLRAFERIGGARQVVDAPPATRDELLLAHDAGYVDGVLQLRGHYGRIDDETSLSPGSVDAARRAIGAALLVVDEIVAGRARRGFALARPPGHHAGRASGGGYCVFNNVAVAALTAKRSGTSRVLVVDTDVHHGNGTEEILADVPGVLFVSLHQDGLFPTDTGALTIPTAPEVGGVLNLPIPPLAVDADYEYITRNVLHPLAQRFRPEFVLVSAGFDAHWRDEQGGMRLSSRGLVALMGALRHLADEFAGGRIAYVLEGGYDLETLEACVLGTLEMLTGASAEWPEGDPPREVLRELVATVRNTLELSEVSDGRWQR